MHATAHTSYWQETAEGESPRYPALDHELRVDVAVLGGGITGLTAALHLQEAGQRVAVLEEAHIGSGTTGFTSGHLDATTDTPLARLIFDFGLQRAMTVAAANRDAIDQIEARCERYGDCEFRRIPSYQFTESTTGLTNLNQQCEAARKLEYHCRITRQMPLPFPYVGAVEVADQGRFHSLRYLRHLAEEFVAAGGEIFENTTAMPPDDGFPCEVLTEGGRVLADTVFVATHSPFLRISQFEFRVFPYQSYVIAARLRNQIGDALYWDDADPYHYIRLASPSDPSLVLIGGADHKTGQLLDERDQFAEIEQYAADRFDVQAVEHRWSAQYFIPADGLPHIGRVPGREHLFMATGYSGTGLTWGTVAGSLVARMILGQRHPLEEILNPGRITPLASARMVLSENLDAMRHFALDRVSGTSNATEEQIAPGTGQVISLDGRQTAVYRSAAGELHRLSPVCTHAGCIVHWNDAEHTWDCPCHGGRYTAIGARFAGPPTQDLEPHRHRS
jgi:glycine/D-amino acid oxidase-like deaminating enzyme/nitrite reductase/ring-hydroxylating ferredoxin subunit